MQRNPKISRVVRAIQEAKTITPKGEYVKVFLSEIVERGRVEELHNILRILEDEKILTLMRFPRGLDKLPPGYVWKNFQTGETSSIATEYFTVDVNQNFDNWCAQYWETDSERAALADQKATEDSYFILTGQQKTMTDIINGIDADQGTALRAALKKSGRIPEAYTLLKGLGMTDQQINDFWQSLQPPSIPTKGSPVDLIYPESDKVGKGLIMPDYSVTLDGQIVGKWNPDTNQIEPVTDDAKPPVADWKNKVPLRYKKIIWRKLAERESLETIRAFFERQPKYPKYTTKTLRRVKNELRHLPPSQTKSLTVEITGLADLIASEK